MNYHDDKKLTEVSKIFLIPDLIMKKSNDKIFELLYETEKVADKIICNRKSIVELSQKKEDVREAIREAGKSTDEGKVWISISSMMVKTSKENAMKLLKKGIFKGQKLV